VGEEPSRRNAGGGGRFSVSSQTFSPRSSLTDDVGDAVIMMEVRLVGGGGLIICCIDPLRVINVATAPGIFHKFSF
jgi:hypothetical protein